MDLGRSSKSPVNSLVVAGLLQESLDSPGRRVDGGPERAVLPAPAVGFNMDLIGRDAILREALEVIKAFAEDPNAAEPLVCAEEFLLKFQAASLDTHTPSGGLVEAMEKRMADAYDRALPDHPGIQWEGYGLALEEVKRHLELPQGLAHLVIQEGGSSTELYVHSWDSLADAENDRIECTRDGAYRTSEVISVPADLAAHPLFYDVAERLLGASHSLGYVEGDENQ